MSKVVFDASALLALLNEEPGSDDAARMIGDAAISAVNLSEVVGKLAEIDMPKTEIREALESLALDIHGFDEEAAFQTGFLRPATKAKGLSLGDRACLALGATLELPVLTTDHAWQDLDLEIEVRLLR